jgi:hypothetical protein
MAGPQPECPVQVSHGMVTVGPVVQLRLKLMPGLNKSGQL